MSIAQFDSDIKLFSFKQLFDVYRKSNPWDFYGIKKEDEFAFQDYSQIHSEVPGILDPFLRNTLKEYLFKTNSAHFTNKEKNVCLTFIDKGLLAVSKEDMMIVHAFLSHIADPKICASLGLSLEQIQEINENLEILPEPDADEAQWAEMVREYFIRAKNIGDSEQAYREKMYLVDPDATEIEFIINTMFQKGALSQSMSAEDIAKAVLAYMQGHFNYIRETKALDGRPMDYWQSIEETMARGGGDCEDLAILQASLLMNALKHKGYSQEQINTMVKLSAGYLKYGAMGSVGHMAVKFSVGAGKNQNVYMLDSTAKNGFFTQKEYAFQTVFEFNHINFQAFSKIDDAFITAQEYKNLNVEEYVDRINLELKIVELILKLRNWDVLDNDQLIEDLRKARTSGDFDAMYDQLVGNYDNLTSLGSNLMLPRSDLQGNVYERLDPNDATVVFGLSDILNTLDSLVGLPGLDMFLGTYRIVGKNGQLQALTSWDLKNHINKMQERQRLMEEIMDEATTRARKLEIRQELKDKGLKNLSSLWKRIGPTNPLEFIAGYQKEYTFFNLTRTSVDFSPIQPLLIAREDFSILNVDLNPFQPKEYFYVATLKPQAFTNYMNIIRDKVNRVGVLFALVYGYIERVNIEARELHDLQYTDAERDEVKRARESADKLQQKFVSSFNRFLGKVKESLQEVASQYMNFVTNFNTGQTTMIQYKIDLWAREILEGNPSLPGGAIAAKIIAALANTGLATVSEIINEMTGIFDVLRAHARMQLGVVDAMVSATNAQAAAVIARTMTECVQLWDGSSEDQAAVTSAENAYGGMHFGRRIWDVLNTTGDQLSLNPLHTKRGILTRYYLDVEEVRFLQYFIQPVFTWPPPADPGWEDIADNIDTEESGGAAAGGAIDQLITDMTTRENEAREAEWIEEHPEDPSLPPKPDDPDWDPDATPHTYYHYWVTEDEVRYYYNNDLPVPPELVRPTIQAEIEEEYGGQDPNPDDFELDEPHYVPQVALYHVYCWDHRWLSIPNKIIADAVYWRSIAKQGGGSGLDKGATRESFWETPWKNVMYHQAPGYDIHSVGPLILGGYYIDYNVEKQVMFREYLLNFQNIVRTALYVQQAYMESFKEAAKSIGGRGQAGSVSALKDTTKQALEVELGKQKQTFEAFYDLNSKLTSGVNNLIKARFEFANAVVDQVLKVARTVSQVVLAIVVLIAVNIVKRILNAFTVTSSLAEPVGDWLGYFLETSYGAEIELYYHEYRLIARSKMNEWLYPEVMHFHSKHYSYQVTDRYKLPAVESHLSGIDSTMGGDQEAEYYSTLMNKHLLDARMLYSGDWDASNKSDNRIMNEWRDEYRLNFYWMDQLGSTIFSQKGPPFSTYLLPKQTPEYILDRSDGHFGFDGIKHGDNQIRMARYFNKVKLLLVILKAQYDAVFNALAVMFNTRKLNTIADFEAQIDANIEFEEQLAQAFQQEVQTYLSGLEEFTAQKEEDLYDHWAGYINSYLQYYTALISLTFPMQAAKVLHTGADMQLDLLDLIRNYLIGEFAGAYNKLYIDGSPIPFVGEIFDFLQKGRSQIDKPWYDVTLPDNSADNLMYYLLEEEGDKDAAIAAYKENYYTEDSEAYREYKAKQILPYMRLDYREDQLARQVYDKDMMVPAIGFAGYQQLDFAKMMESQRKVSDLIALRTFYLMIDQAIYHARNMALREMFGVSSSAAILDTAMQAMDRYNQAQLSRLDDLAMEHNQRVTSYNKYFNEAVVQSGVQGLASIIGTVAIMLLLKLQVGLGSDKFWKNLLFKATKVFSSTSMWKALLNSAVGVVFLLGQTRQIPLDSRNASKPASPEESVDKGKLQEEEKKDEKEGESNEKDEKEAKQQEQKILSGEGDSGLSQYDISGAGFSAGPQMRFSSRGKMIVNPAGVARQKTQIKRRFRKLKLLREIGLALQFAKADAAAEMGGVEASKAGKDIMKGIGTFERADSMIAQSRFNALKAKAEALNRAVDKLREGITHFVSSAVNKVADKMSSFLKSKGSAAKKPKAGEMSKKGAKERGTGKKQTKAAARAMRGATMSLMGTMLKQVFGQYMTDALITVAVLAATDAEGGLALRGFSEGIEEGPEGESFGEDAEMKEEVDNAGEEAAAGSSSIEVADTGEIENMNMSLEYLKGNYSTRREIAQVEIQAFREIASGIVQTAKTKAKKKITERVGEYATRKGEEALKHKIEEAERTGDFSKVSGPEVSAFGKGSAGGAALSAAAKALKYSPFKVHTAMREQIEDIQGKINNMEGQGEADLNEKFQSLPEYTSKRDKFIDQAKTKALNLAASSQTQTREFSKADVAQFAAVNAARFAMKKAISNLPQGSPEQQESQTKMAGIEARMQEMGKIKEEAGSPVERIQLKRLKAGGYLKHLGRGTYEYKEKFYQATDQQLEKELGLASGDLRSSAVVAKLRQEALSRENVDQVIGNMKGAMEKLAQQYGAFTAQVAEQVSTDTKGVETLADQLFKEQKPKEPRVLAISGDNMPIMVKEENLEEMTAGKKAVQVTDDRDGKKYLVFISPETKVTDLQQQDLARIIQKPGSQIRFEQMGPTDELIKQIKSYTQEEKNLAKGYGELLAQYNFERELEMIQAETGEKGPGVTRRNLEQINELWETHQNDRKQAAADAALQAARHALLGQGIQLPQLFTGQLAQGSATPEETIMKALNRAQTMIKPAVPGFQEIMQNAQIAGLQRAGYRGKVEAQQLYSRMQKEGLVDEFGSTKLLSRAKLDEKIQALGYAQGSKGFDALKNLLSGVTEESLQEATGLTKKEAKWLRTELIKTGYITQAGFAESAGFTQAAFIKDIMKQTLTGRRGLDAGGVDSIVGRVFEDILDEHGRKKTHDQAGNVLDITDRGLKNRLGAILTDNRISSKEKSALIPLLMDTVTISHNLATAAGLPGGKAGPLLGLEGLLQESQGILTNRERIERELFPEKRPESKLFTKIDNLVAEKLTGMPKIGEGFHALSEFQNSIKALQNVQKTQAGQAYDHYAAVVSTPEFFNVNVGLTKNAINLDRNPEKVSTWGTWRDVTDLVKVWRLPQGIWHTAGLARRTSNRIFRRVVFGKDDTRFEGARERVSQGFKDNAATKVAYGAQKFPPARLFTRLGRTMGSGTKASLYFLGRGKDKDIQEKYTQINREEEQGHSADRFFRAAKRVRAREDFNPFKKYVEELSKLKSEIGPRTTRAERKKINERMIELREMATVEAARIAETEGSFDTVALNLLKLAETEPSAKRLMNDILIRFRRESQDMPTGWLGKGRRVLKRGVLGTRDPREARTGAVSLAGRALDRGPLKPLFTEKDPEYAVQNQFASLVQSINKAADTVSGETMKDISGLAATRMRNYEDYKGAKSEMDVVDKGMNLAYSYHRTWKEALKDLRHFYNTREKNVERRNQHQLLMGMIQDSSDRELVQFVRDLNNEELKTLLNSHSRRKALTDKIAGIRDNEGGKVNEAWAALQAQANQNDPKPGYAGLDVASRQAYEQYSAAKSAIDAMISSSPGLRIRPEAHPVAVIPGSETPELRGQAAMERLKKEPFETPPYGAPASAGPDSLKEFWQNEEEAQRLTNPRLQEEKTLEGWNALNKKTLPITMQIVKGIQSGDADDLGQTRAYLNLFGGALTQAGAVRGEAEKLTSAIGERIADISGGPAQERNKRVLDFLDSSAKYGTPREIKAAMTISNAIINRQKEAPGGQAVAQALPMDVMDLKDTLDKLDLLHKEYLSRRDREVMGPALMASEENRRVLAGLLASGMRYGGEAADLAKKSLEIISTVTVINPQSKAEMEQLRDFIIEEISETTQEAEKEQVVDQVNKEITSTINTAREKAGKSEQLNENAGPALIHRAQALEILQQSRVEQEKSLFNMYQRSPGNSKSVFYEMIRVNPMAAAALVSDLVRVNPSFGATMFTSSAAIMRGTLNEIDRQNIPAYYHGFFQGIKSQVPHPITAPEVEAAALERLTEMEDQIVKNYADLLQSWQDALPPGAQRLANMTQLRDLAVAKRDRLGPTVILERIIGFCNMYIDSQDVAVKVGLETVKARAEILNLGARYIEPAYEKELQRKTYLGDVGSAFFKKDADAFTIQDGNVGLKEAGHTRSEELRSGLITSAISHFSNRDDVRDALTNIQADNSRPNAVTLHGLLQEPGLDAYETRMLNQILTLSKMDQVYTFYQAGGGAALPLPNLPGGNEFVAGFLSASTDEQLQDFLTNANAITMIASAIDGIQDDEMKFDISARLLKLGATPETRNGVPIQNGIPVLSVLTVLAARAGNRETAADVQQLLTETPSPMPTRPAQKSDALTLIENRIAGVAGQANADWDVPFSSYIKLINLQLALGNVRLNTPASPQIVTAMKAHGYAGLSSQATINDVLQVQNALPSVHNAIDASPRQAIFELDEFQNQITRGGMLNRAQFTALNGYIADPLIANGLKTSHPGLYNYIISNPGMPSAIANTIITPTMQPVLAPIRRITTIMQAPQGPAAAYEPIIDQLEGLNPNERAEVVKFFVQTDSPKFQSALMLGAQATNRFSDVANLLGRVQVAQTPALGQPVSRNQLDFLVNLAAVTDTFSNYGIKVQQQISQTSDQLKDNVLSGTDFRPQLLNIRDELISNVHEISDILKTTPEAFKAQWRAADNSETMLFKTAKTLVQIEKAFRDSGRIPEANHLKDTIGKLSVSVIHIAANGSERAISEKLSVLAPVMTFLAQPENAQTAEEVFLSLKNELALPLFRSRVLEIFKTAPQAAPSLEKTLVNHFISANKPIALSSFIRSALTADPARAKELIDMVPQASQIRLINSVYAKNPDQALSLLQHMPNADWASFTPFDTLDATNLDQPNFNDVVHGNSALNPTNQNLLKTIAYSASILKGMSLATYLNAAAVKLGINVDDLNKVLSNTLQTPAAPPQISNPQNVVGVPPMPDINLAQSNEARLTILNNLVIQHSREPNPQAAAQIRANLETSLYSLITRQDNSEIIDVLSRFIIDPDNQAMFNQILANLSPVIIDRFEGAVVVQPHSTQLAHLLVNLNKQPAFTDALKQKPLATITNPEMLYAKALLQPKVWEELDTDPNGQDKVSKMLTLASQLNQIDRLTHVIPTSTYAVNTLQSLIENEGTRTHGLKALNSFNDQPEFINKILVKAGAAAVNQDAVPQNQKDRVQSFLSDTLGDFRFLTYKNKYAAMHALVPTLLSSMMEGGNEGPVRDAQETVIDDFIRSKNPNKKMAANLLGWHLVNTDRPIQAQRIISAITALKQIPKLEDGALNKLSTHLGDQVVRDKLAILHDVDPYIHKLLLQTISSYQEANSGVTAQHVKADTLLPAAAPAVPPAAGPAAPILPKPVLQALRDANLDGASFVAKLRGEPQAFDAARNEVISRMQKYGFVSGREPSGEMRRLTPPEEQRVYDRLANAANIAEVTAILEDDDPNAGLSDLLTDGFSALSSSEKAVRLQTLIYDVTALIETINNNPLVAQNRPLNEQAMIRLSILERNDINGKVNYSKHVSVASFTSMDPVFEQRNAGIGVQPFFELLMDDPARRTLFTKGLAAKLAALPAGQNPWQDPVIKNLSQGTSQNQLLNQLLYNPPADSAADAHRISDMLYKSLANKPPRSVNELVARYAVIEPHLTKVQKQSVLKNVRVSLGDVSDYINQIMLSTLPKSEKLELLTDLQRKLETSTSPKNAARSVLNALKPQQEADDTEENFDTKVEIFSAVLAKMIDKAPDMFRPDTSTVKVRTFNSPTRIFEGLLAGNYFADEDLTNNVLDSLMQQGGETNSLARALDSAYRTANTRTMQYLKRKARGISAVETRTEAVNIEKMEKNLFGLMERANAEAGQQQMMLQFARSTGNTEMAEQAEEALQEARKINQPANSALLTLISNVVTSGDDKKIAGRFVDFLKEIGDEHVKNELVGQIVEKAPDLIYSTKIDTKTMLGAKAGDTYTTAITREGTVRRESQLLAYLDSEIKKTPPGAELTKLQALHDSITSALQAQKPLLASSYLVSEMRESKKPVAGQIRQLLFGDNITAETRSERLKSLIYHDRRQLNVPQSQTMLKTILTEAQISYQTEMQKPPANQNADKIKSALQTAAQIFMDEPALAQSTADRFPEVTDITAEIGIPTPLQINQAKAQIQSHLTQGLPESALLAQLERDQIDPLEMILAAGSLQQDKSGKWEGLQSRLITHLYAEGVKQGFSKGESILRQFVLASANKNMPPDELQKRAKATLNLMNLEKNKALQIEQAEIDDTITLIDDLSRNIVVPAGPNINNRGLAKAAALFFTDRSGRFVVTDYNNPAQTAKLRTIMSDWGKNLAPIPNMYETAEKIRLTADIYLVVNAQDSRADRALTDLFMVDDGVLAGTQILEPGMNPPPARTALDSAIKARWGIDLSGKTLEEPQIPVLPGYERLQEAFTAFNASPTQVSLAGLLSAIERPSTDEIVSKLTGLVQAWPPAQINYIQANLGDPLLLEKLPKDLVEALNQFAMQNGISRDDLQQRLVEAVTAVPNMGQFLARLDQIGIRLKSPGVYMHDPAWPLERFKNEAPNVRQNVIRDLGVRFPQFTREIELVQALYTNNGLSQLAFERAADMFKSASRNTENRVASKVPEALLAVKEYLNSIRADINDPDEQDVIGLAGPDRDQQFTDYLASLFTPAVYGTANGIQQFQSQLQAFFAQGARIDRYDAVLKMTASITEAARQFNLKETY
ncbi:hypothetical protein ACFL96_00995 [Thermoproteota archaeon]